MPKKQPNNEVILTTGELAHAFGVSRKTIGVWGKAGCPKRGRGKWAIHEVIKWYLDTIVQSQDDQDSTLADARRRYWHFKAENERMKAQQTEKSLIPWEEVSIEWSKRAAEYKNGCFELVNNLPPELEGKTQPEMRARIYGFVWSLFDRVCRIGTFCPVGQDGEPEKAKE